MQALQDASAICNRLCEEGVVRRWLFLHRKEPMYPGLLATRMVPGQLLPLRVL